jgi:DNA-binding NarL/FixJ family response regulator
MVMDSENFVAPRTVALIDRFPTIRTGLRVLLTNRLGNIRILEASEVSRFYKAHRKEVPDLIFIGLSQVEDADNFELLLQLRGLYPDAKVIVQDLVPVPRLVPQYFHAGISGYLTIKTSEYELGECISNVLNGKRYIDNEGLILLLDSVPAQVSKPILPRKLTMREIEIANYMIQGAKVSEIAGILGRQLSTISTIKKNIYRKLHVSNLIELNAVIIGSHH